MLAEGAAVDAAQTFAAILEEDPENAPAYGGLVRAHIATGDLDQAEAVLNGAPAEISEKPELEAAHAQLDLAKQAANAGPVGELQAAVDADADNHQARLDLATRCTPTGMCKAPSINCSNCSVVTGNGTRPPPRLSF